MTTVSVTSTSELRSLGLVSRSPCEAWASIGPWYDELATGDFLREHIKAMLPTGPSTVGLLLDTPPMRVPEPEYYPLHMRADVAQGC